MTIDPAAQSACTSSKPLTATGIAATILAEWAERGLNTGDMLNVDILADAIQRHVVACRPIDNSNARDLAVAKAVLEAARKVIDARQRVRCLKCGNPRDNHPYRHPFVGEYVAGSSDIIRALDPAQIIASMENEK